MSLSPEIQIALIAAVAFGASLLSSMSGGGSSMIATPVWLMLGFPLPVAICSNCVCGSVWTLVAARSYLRGQSIDVKLLSGLSAFGLAGALLGTQVILNCDPSTLQRVIGAIILSLVIYAQKLRSGRKRTTPDSVSHQPRSFAAGLL